MSDPVQTGLAIAWLKPCALCGDHDVAATAVFVPTDEMFNRELGARLGSTRHVFYALCARCLERPDRNDAVEAGMLEWAARLAA
jgi:hypothetical protein